MSKSFSSVNSVFRCRPLARRFRRFPARSFRFFFVVAVSCWRFWYLYGKSSKSFRRILHADILSTPSFLPNFLAEFALVVGFRLFIPLARKIFSLLLALFFLPLPGRSSLLPVSSNRLIALLTVLWDIPRKSTISITVFPRSWARIIASLKLDKLFIIMLKKQVYITEKCIKSKNSSPFHNFDTPCIMDKYYPNAPSI
jgi:hypothetical protein